MLTYVLLTGRQPFSSPKTDDPMVVMRRIVDDSFQARGILLCREVKRRAPAPNALVDALASGHKADAEGLGWRCCSRCCCPNSSSFACHVVPLPLCCRSSSRPMCRQLPRTLCCACWSASPPSGWACCRCVCHLFTRAIQGVVSCMIDKSTGLGYEGCGGLV